MSESPTLDTPLRALPALLVDVQASGATPEKGHVIDIAWWPFDLDGRIEAEATASLVALPDDARLPRRVTQLTGITAEMLTGAPDRDAVRAALEAARTDHGAVFVAHYAIYERRFLNDWFEDPPDILCTHEIAKRALPGLPRRGLRALAGYFGAPHLEVKRAGDHVVATALIWSELVDILDIEHDVQTLGELHAWLRDTRPQKGERTFPLPREVRLAMPERPGVYRMLNRHEEVLYVGKATSLKARVNSYFRGKKGQGERKLEMATQVWGLDVTEVATPLEAALLEADEIKRLDPPYNQLLKRGERKVWFASADDFFDVTHAPDDDHLIGPFTSPVWPQTLGTIAEALDDDPGVLASAFYAPDPGAPWEDGLALFRARHGLTGDVDAHDLLALGESLWEAYLEEVAAREAAGEEVDAEGAGEVDEDPSEEVEEWTDEDIADALERMVSRGARAVRRAGHLATLIDCALTWSPMQRPGVELARWGVRFEAGVLVGTGADIAREGWPERGLVETLEAVDVDVYDRLSVLVGELHRLVREGSLLTLHRAGFQPLSGDAVVQWMRRV